jgi:hypothetical protein
MCAVVADVCCKATACAGIHQTTACLTARFVEAYASVCVDILLLAAVLRCCTTC